MSAFALLAILALGQKQPIDTTQAFEGVWADTSGNVMFAGNGRVDYNIEDRYYSAMMSAVPDGSLLGNFGAGRGIDFILGRPLPSTSTDDLLWGTPSHLAPTAAGMPKVATLGETRLTAGARNSSGYPIIASLTSKASTSNGSGYTMLKLMGFDSFSLAGKYGDRDLQVEIADPAGRTSSFTGTLTYLGQKRVFSGRRIMGRAGFVTFVTSRLGSNGNGFIVWTPSTDRLIKMRDHNSTDTDRITIRINLAGAGTAAGVDKVLPRLP